MLAVATYQEGTKPMLIFMKTKFPLTPVAVAVFCLGAAQCAFSQNTPAVSRDVKSLGRGQDDLKIVETLAKTPTISTELLIGELHPIPEARILNGQKEPEAEHVLWCIRALRYITGGKDFCARTGHKFGSSDEEQNRKYWIYFRHETCASFFAMWPSRASEYIAPEDAQVSIIQQWKDWLAKEGASFDYKPMRNPKPEDWLW
jgi:hypothetical protein